MKTAKIKIINSLRGINTENRILIIGFIGLIIQIGYYGLIIKNGWFVIISASFLGGAIIIEILRRLNYTKIVSFVLDPIVAKYTEWRGTRTIHKSQKKPVDWQYVRETLYTILLENDILIAESKAKKTNKTVDRVIHSIDETMQSFLQDNPRFVEMLRKIGIDGLLCLMFLLEQLPALTTAKVMQKILNIPVATLYRQLQKLTDEELIEIQYITNKPNTTYYRITEQGTSIVIQLYEFLGGTILAPINTLEEKRSEIETET